MIFILGDVGPAGDREVVGLLRLVTGNRRYTHAWEMDGVYFECMMCKMGVSRKEKKNVRNNYIQVSPELFRR